MLHQSLTSSGRSLRRSTVVFLLSSYCLSLQHLAFDSVTTSDWIFNGQTAKQPSIYESYVTTHFCDVRRFSILSCATGFCHCGEFYRYTIHRGAGRARWGSTLSAGEELCWRMDACFCSSPHTYVLSQTCNNLVSLFKWRKSNGLDTPTLSSSRTVCFRLHLLSLGNSSYSPFGTAHIRFRFTKYLRPASRASPSTISSLLFPVKILSSLVRI